MQRPTRAALGRLLQAAFASDLDLDRALCDVGVLPPADLAPVRDALSWDHTELALARNRDGHCIVQVVRDAQLAALVHHDGRVHLMSAAA